MVLIAVVLMATGAMAQETPGMNRSSAEAIAAQVKTLTEAARKSATGIGVEVTLEKYPKHYSMLVVRSKTGEVEIHVNYDDVFLVLDCEATEMTRWDGGGCEDDSGWGDEGIAAGGRVADAGGQERCDPYRGEYAALDGARAG